MIRQEIKVGQKFQIGGSNNAPLRMLEATSVSSLGVIFKVSPGTYTNKNTEMFVHFNDKDFWSYVKPYKEKIVHQKDVVFYRYGPSSDVLSCLKPVGYPLYGTPSVELYRTTVTYTEEK